MKASFHIFLLILVIATVQPCFSSGKKEAKPTADGTEISARGALGGLGVAPSDPLYTGDGGKSIRLAVLAPQIQGEAPGYLPIYIQGLLNNNFNKFSAINLIDRQNLDKILSEQKLTASGNYSDNDFVRIGNLTNAQYFLFGTIQKLSGDRYSLQLSITDSSTGVRRANFMKDGTLSQLEGKGTLINEATADLLAQMGIKLTETGLQTLLAGNTSAVKAEAGLARGITAQASGSEIEALFNFTQAITFDPSQIEALSRLNTISSNISGGTISQRILNDIQARDSWLNAFKETARFFNEHPPFEIIFDPNLIQIGQTDYASRTANIGMRIALDPSQAGFSALNALLEGLEKTGKRGAWGFSGWPLMELSPRTAGTVVFDGRRSLSYKVDIALLNEKNKTIGNGSITLTTETMGFSAGDKTVIPPNNVEQIVSFPNIKAEDLTPTLTIVIVAVNGISSRQLNATGYMKIETGDLSRHTSIAESVAFSHDGRQIISGGHAVDGTIKLWDATTLRLIKTFSDMAHEAGIYSIVFSPDGKQILFSGIRINDSYSGFIKLLDAISGKEIKAFSDGHVGREGSYIRSLAFSPDGKQIISGADDNTIKLWDVATGRKIITFSGHIEKNGIKGINSLAFSPNGRQIISGSADSTIKLWDVATGREIRTFSGHTSRVLSVAFSHDSKQIISGSADSTIKLWDATTGREIRTFSGHTNLVTSVSFSPDGIQILSGSSDNTIKIWNITTDRELRTFSGHSDIIFQSYYANGVKAAFSSDGRQIISASFSFIKLWDVTTGKLIGTRRIAEW